MCLQISFKTFDLQMFLDKNVAPATKIKCLWDHFIVLTRFVAINTESYNVFLCFGTSKTVIDAVRRSVVASSQEFCYLKQKCGSESRCRQDDRLLSWLTIGEASHNETTCGVTTRRQTTTEPSILMKTFSVYTKYDNFGLKEKEVNCCCCCCCVVATTLFSLSCVKFSLFFFCWCRSNEFLFLFFWMNDKLAVF